MSKYGYKLYLINSYYSEELSDMSQTYSLQSDKTELTQRWFSLWELLVI